MQRDANDAKRLSAPATAATTSWGTYTLIFAATGLIFIAVWYFGGDRFITTPTMGGTNGNAPAATPVPAK
jgi:hypothetical protein